MSHRLRVMLLGIILLAFLLRLYQLDFQPIWSDEADLVVFSTQPLPEILNNFSRAGWNGPLYHMILYCWFQLTGTDIFVLRYLSVLFAILGIAIGYPLGNKLLSSPVGFVSSFLMAVSPYLVWYAQDGKMYSLLLSLTMVTTLSLIHACQNKSWRASLVYILVTVASLYIHIFAVLLLPFHFVLFLFFSPKSLRKYALLFVMLLAVLNIPLLRWEIPLWISSINSGREFFSLSTIIGIQLFVLSIGYPSSFQLLSAVLMLFLFFTGTYYSLKMASGRIMLFYFLLPILTIYAISLGTPLYTDRYLITIAPAFYMICAVSLTVSRRRAKGIFLGVILLLLILHSATILVQSNTITKPAFTFLD